MSDQVASGTLAVALGAVVALVLLVPTAAYQYRLDGRLGRGDLTTLLGAAVYGVALWTYTLLPFPARPRFACRPARLDPLESIRGIGHSPDLMGASFVAAADGGLHTFTVGPPSAADAIAAGMDGHVPHLPLWQDPVLLQLLFNVALFLPLGYFVRVIVRPRHGVLLTTALGLVVSGLIETTQLTGDWHVFRCAYRTFDVDDLLTNTLGALLGALVAAALVRRRHPAPVPLPTSVTLGRRWVGLVCDGVFLMLAGAVAAFGYRTLAGHHLLGVTTYHRHAETLVLALVPLAVEAAVVLGVGRTVGEVAVSVRAVPRGRTAAWRARAVKSVVGVLPLPALLVAGDLVGGRGGDVLALVGAAGFAVGTFAAAAATRGHRGLSHLAARMDLEIATEEEFDVDHDGRPGVG